MKLFEFSTLLVLNLIYVTLKHCTYLTANARMNCTVHHKHTVAFLWHLSLKRYPYACKKCFKLLASTIPKGLRKLDTSFEFIFKHL